ncbi:hypothetical protein X978_227 [Burkholderia pseudomallei MSHR3965]|nr:SOS response-associated peptidase [Burkholderia pseudomallei]AIV83946.1 hypothetical protein X978_227 [Burkholderia pseudomallei MSHR3965]KGT00592.1 hypothetical protein JT30_151 [Burkholderia pseudomallei]
MAMITVNAGDHSIMSRMHSRATKSGQSSLRPDDWEAWLTTSNAEAARAMLQRYPAGDMVAAPK